MNQTVALQKRKTSTSYEDEEILKGEALYRAIREAQKDPAIMKVIDDFIKKHTN